MLEYLYSKKKAYFESQSLLRPKPKVPHGRLLSLFKLLHYRQWTKACSGIQEGLIMKFNFELPFALQKLNIIVRKYNMDFASFILPASL